MAFSIRYDYLVTDRFSGPLKRIKAAMNKASQSAEFMSRRMSVLNTRMATLKKRSDAARGSLLEVAAMAYIFAKPIQSAIEFESAMADVRKVVDFKTPDGLEKMSRTILQMSQRLPLTTTELAKIVASGGQMGVPADELAKFALIATKMSIAFDIMPSEAGDAMAKMSNIFRIPITEMELIGDAINHLSDSTASTAADITRALKNKAAAAGLAMGLEAKQTVALTSAFIQMAIPVDRVGSVMENMARTFTDTTKVGAKMVEMFQSDGAGALTLVFEKLNKLEGADRITAFNKLFGEMGLRVAQLADNMPLLQRSFRLATQESEFLGSMTREFNVRMATTEVKIQLATNKFSALGKVLGATLLPTLGLIVGVFGGIAGVLAFLGSEFPVLTGVLTNFIAAVVLIRIATIAWNFVQAQTLIALLATKTAILSTAIGTRVWAASVFLISTAMRAFTLVMWAVNAAMAANIIGLIIIGLALLAAGIAFVIIKWDWLVDKFRSAMEWLQPIADAFAGIFGGGDVDVQVTHHTDPGMSKGGAAPESLAAGGIANTSSETKVTVGVEAMKGTRGHILSKESRGASLGTNIAGNL